MTPGAAPVGVMLVDDDPFIREVAAVAFGLQPGVAVTAYATAAAALAAVQAAGSVRGAAAPGVIVLDVGLPDMDGLDLFLRLRAVLAPMPPTAFLTAHEDAALAARLRAAGAARVFVKPFDPLVLARDVLALARAAPCGVEALAPDPRLAAVMAGFRASLPATVDGIAAACAALRAAWAPPVAEDLAMRTHKLAGSAGLFKLYALGDAAYAAELAVRAQMDAARRNAAVETAAIEAAVAALQAAARAALEAEKAS